MKLVLASDLHVTCRGVSINGIDHVERLTACARSIIKYVPDADLCVLMGDLAQTPSAEEYDLLYQILRVLPMPVQPILGNHDDRRIFNQTWPKAQKTEGDFVQARLQTDCGTLLFLDTVTEGSNAGSYCGQRQEWLKQELSGAGSSPVYIFMHHPPFDLGFSVDESKLRDATAVAAIFEEAGNVRHIFIGHTHRAAAGNWRGIAWTGLHGTGLQHDLTFAPAKPGVTAGPAQIGVMLLNATGDTVVHFHDFLEPYPVLARRWPRPQSVAHETNQL